ncbi:MAG: hypothetical protein JWP75_2444 [Frondihabitans sp.]|nr:hypothetical protein [Frondihabitans sp.]
MTTREHLARAMWTLIEPIHALNYFSDEARGAFADIGLPRFWDGYFAGRAAPLGAVTAAPVVAMFSGFSPFLVGRALPSVWADVSPEGALEARLVGAEGAIRRILASAGITEAVVAEAADALAAVVSRVDTVGRPLAAANAALPVPEGPYRRLWQATSTLREHRGDGHVIALVTEGVAGLSTIVLRSALDLSAATMKGARGWTDEQWDAESAALTARGLLASDGSLTETGADALNRAEEQTNRLALTPWAALAEHEVVAIARLLLPIARACGATYPYPNPIGMPAVWDPEADPDARAVLEAPASPAL